MRHFFIFLITLYQRYISPYKGFRCAYGCYHKTSSCSAMVKNIIAEHGLLAGWPLIKQQFANCQLAYQSLETEREKRERRKKDSGNCNVDTSSCNCNVDTPDCSGCIPDLPCDGLNCSLLKFRPIKKSIHSSHIKPNKYDIKSGK